MRWLSRRPRLLVALGVWMLALAVWPVLVAIGRATATALDREGAPGIRIGGVEATGLLDIGFLAFTILVPVAALLSVVLPFVKDVRSPRFRVSSRFVKTGRTLGWIALVVAVGFVSHIASQFLGYFGLYPSFLAWLH